MILKKLQRRCKSRQALCIKVYVGPLPPLLKLWKARPVLEPSRYSMLYSVYRPKEGCQLQTTHAVCLHFAV